MTEETLKECGEDAFYECKQRRRRLYEWRLWQHDNHYPPEMRRKEATNEATSGLYLFCFSLVWTFAISTG